MTLAVSMLKQADLVLLDEPTNHLDEESVEWLGNYVNSITGASVFLPDPAWQFSMSCVHKEIEAMGLFPLHAAYLSQTWFLFHAGPPSTPFCILAGGEICCCGV